ncbi:MAG TPA: ABATE domain-containing protein [Candidatus Angelobacter sp.]
MKKTRGSQVAEVRDGFLFLGNQLVLDFLNTYPVLNGRPTELLTDFKALLRWFQAAGLLTGGEAQRLQRQWGASDRARRTVEEMQQFREKVRAQVIAWESGKPIQAAVITELNRLMRLRPMRMRLTVVGRPPTIEMWFDTEEPADLFAPLAHSAASFFGEVDRGRVRKCANCVLHFHDTSKKGTRRWCSMQFCGNRAKVAAYAARQRSRM